MADNLYANVVVDVKTGKLSDRLFTYHVPDHLAFEVFIGTQVLVPFGKRNRVSGYIVSLSDRNEAKEFEIRDITEVLDDEPLFDRTYIEFLHWIADYYCSSLQDVIQAAVPSDFSPRLKRIVKLAKQDTSYQSQSTGTVPEIHQTIPGPSDIASGARQLEPARKSILSLLKKSRSSSLSLTVLKQRWKKVANAKQTHFYQALNILRQEGVVTVETESSKPPGPKFVKTIICTGAEGQTQRQKTMLSMLAGRGGQMSLKQFMAEGKTTLAMIKRLQALGLVALSQEESLRDPLKSTFLATSPTSQTDFKLTGDQENVLERILPELKYKLLSTNKSAKTSNNAVPKAYESVKVQGSENHDPWLILGVTGSGKTEIYLRLISEVLAHGRSALYLVPEISLTSQLSRRLTDRFGNKVAIWHSALSPGERYDTWRRIRAKDVRVLLGARSAVMAHMPDLGIIVIDEEHDASYKQANPSPRYHVREVAVEKARRYGATVVMGSATPDLCSYTSALDKKRLLRLKSRVGSQDLPEVTIVDMRQEFTSGNRSIFSSLLIDSLNERLDKGEQAILLLNRRGYASHVFCRACGFVVKCQNCSVPLVFHQGPDISIRSPKDHAQYELGHLACHHCGYHSRPIVSCPSCLSPFIRQFGIGTQRVEQEVRHKFAHARTARLDSDITSKRGAYMQVLQEFAEGKADILIGTQMVSKGLDIPNVTLVGVLAADSAFNLPDYRSTERGFQLLTQVAGRAGRGDKPGLVIFQTYNTNMPALAWARKHDYEAFAQEELEARRPYSYPPFSQLIRIVVSGDDAIPVQASSEQLAEDISRYLEEALPEANLSLLGPAPCMIERLNNKFRFHLLIKNMAGEAGRKALVRFLQCRHLTRDITLAVDVNALDLL